MIIVDLIVPPSRDDTVAVSRSGFFSPLGLLSIATFARQSVRELDVRILDGNITPEGDINIRPEAQVVGFTNPVYGWPSKLRLTVA
jgi:hypothetical protein